MIFKKLIRRNFCISLPFSFTTASFSFSCTHSSYHSQTGTNLHHQLLITKFFDYLLKHERLLYKPSSLLMMNAMMVTPDQIVKILTIS